MTRGALALLLLVATPALSAENGRALHGTVPRALRRMTALGEAPADLPLPWVMVLLGVRHRHLLEAVVAAQQDPRSPLYRRWLDDTELADRFGPSRTEYERVRRWFVAHGFRVVQDSPYRLSLVVAGTAGTVREALGTTIARFRDRGRLYRGPTGEPVLPPDIAPSVRGFFGLDDLPKFRPLVKLDNGMTALAPADFAAAYGIGSLYTSGFTGAGQSIAVLARTNFSDRDIDLFAQRFLTSARVVPRRSFVGRDPGITNDLAEEVEVLIDTQWAGALAPGAQVNVVISTPEGDIPEALAQAVYQREGDIISISFGLCEPAAPALASELFDAFYAFANAKGQTVVVAAGDSGATECAPADRHVAAVNLLASSPHAVAVGGTSFALAPEGGVPGVVDEQVWNDDSGAGGGGESEIFAAPRYQLAAGLAVPSGRRALPDLALAGSPRTPGYVIVAGGQTNVIGGTSAGAPALASLLALVGERLRQTTGAGALGQLNPQLYRLGSEQARGLRPPVYRDVTDGDNALPGSPGFVAGLGYDRASGWGAPMADALAGALEGPGRCEPEIDCLVPGGRSHRSSCGGEWLIEHGALATRRGVPTVRQTCRDGDPLCDVDGLPNGSCTINVALCVNVFDARPSFLNRRGLPACQRQRVRRVRLLDPAPHSSDGNGNRRALLGAIAALPIPGSLRAACTATVPVVVAVRRPGVPGRAVLRARVERQSGATSARLVLRCSEA